MSRKKQPNQYVIILYHCCSSLWSRLLGGSLSHCCSCAACCITSQSVPWGLCTTAQKPPKASDTFTLCTNCKHPSLVSIYLLTKACHRGADKHESMGSVWLRTISLNSRNIPEKQTLQHLPYGERRGTTANHNERWEKRACVESVSAKRARQAAIWTQALYKTHNFQLQEPGGLAYIANTCASGGSWAQLCCCCFSSTVSPAL